MSPVAPLLSVCNLGVYLEADVAMKSHIKKMLLHCAECSLVAAVKMAQFENCLNWNLVLLITEVHIISRSMQ